MLQKIRAGSRTWVGVAMAVFLMVMFGFIGLNEFTGQGGQPTSTVITVGDGEVTGRQYERYYRSVVAQESQRQRRPISYAEAKREGIVRRVNQTLVTQEIYAQALRDLGIMPPLSSIEAQLTRLGPQQLQALLQERGVSASEFAVTLQRELARQHLLGSVSDMRFTPKSVADRLYRLRNERRSATIILVPSNAIKEVPAPTEAQLKAFYEKNLEKYRLETYRVVTALIIRPKDLDQLIKITGDQIRAEYEKNKASYTAPERREVHQFIVKDPKLAKKVEAALNEGRKFDSVAEEIAKAKIDSLGLKPVGEFRAYPVKALGEKVLKMKVGEVAGPFNNPLGGQIFITLVDIKKAEIRPLDDVRQQVVEQIRRRERPKTVANLREQIDDDITEGKTLDQIAEKLKVKALKLESINRQGRDNDGEPYENLPGGANFVRFVFSQAVGNVSNVIDTRDGGLYVVKIEREVKAHTPKLEAVKEKVTADWKREALRRGARELAEKIAAELKSGKKAEDVAKERGLRARTTRALTRGESTASGANAAYIQARVFSAKKGDVVIGRAPTGWAVARIDEISAPDAKEAEKAKKAVHDGFVRSVSASLLIAYDSVLKDRYEINVDQKGIDTLLQRRR